MSELGNRIRSRRLDLGLTQKALADACKVKQASVSAWERGYTLGVRPQNLYLAARKLRTTMEWLATGKGAQEKRATVAEPASAYLVQVAETQCSRIPFITWKEAATMQDTARVPAGDASILTAKEVGPRAYALQVRGDAMEPLFPQGAIIIVDPDHPADDGAYVVVETGEGSEAIFKQLVFEGERRFLRPVNRRYPVLEYDAGTFRICGVVRQMLMDFD